MTQTIVIQAAIIVEKTQQKTCEISFRQVNNLVLENFLNSFILKL